MAWYYGSDRTTDGLPACIGAEPPFYNRRIGAGTSGFENNQFSTVTANSAGPPQTFAYWELEGLAANDATDTMT